MTTTNVVAVATATDRTGAVVRLVLDETRAVRNWTTSRHGTFPFFTWCVVTEDGDCQATELSAWTVYEARRRLVVRHGRGWSNFVVTVLRVRA